MGKFLVTGAGGFIGSNLVDRLLAEGHEVLGVDNFSTGRREFLEGAKENPRFKLYELDLLDRGKFVETLDESIDWVFHFAANADVKDGLKHPGKDLEQNTTATWNVLESMRERGVKKIAFTSTGSVYGEAPKIPTPEDCPFPIQTSLYGASKIAGEALISSYAEGYGFKGLVFRFVSILGERYTHGHVVDFFRQLSEHPDHLDVLGDGSQRKSYLSIQDCINAVTHLAFKNPLEKFEVYNLGTDEYVNVKQSIDVICKEMGVGPSLKFAGGDRGWVGDNPFIFLDCSKVKSTGWKAEIDIREGIGRTVRFLKDNPWVADRPQN